MKIYKKPKTIPLTQVLRELQKGEQLVVDNRQSKIPYVRKVVCFLRKEGYEFTATEKGQINKILVTRIN